AKLMRTWRAILVFSGSTLHGPIRSTMAISRSYVALTSGDLPAKCSARSPNGWQVCDWLRLANWRPQFGQLHSGRASEVIASILAAPGRPAAVALRHPAT